MATEAVQRFYDSELKTYTTEGRRASTDPGTLSSLEVVIQAEIQNEFSRAEVVFERVA